MMNYFYVLWDESHLWGLMLARTLKDLKVPFSIITSENIRDNILKHHPPAGLLVPGGWARLKSQSLGRIGRENIREYIHSSGKYIGFCGGAGLALKSTPDWNSLDLCPWGRKPFRNRLPNFSGHVLCRVKTGSKYKDILLPVWWPSQFDPGSDGSQEIRVIAYYLRPGQDFWSSDLKLSQIDTEDLQKWEYLYGINLDPAYLYKEPCIIHGFFGKGEYILSYSHLETPQSFHANELLISILQKWLNSPKLEHQTRKTSPWDLRHSSKAWQEDTLIKAKQGLDEIISLGQNQFLLFWRLPWLLGWRRGIPGAPINFLYAMTCQALAGRPDEQTINFWNAEKNSFYSDMENFLKDLKLYLAHERLAIALTQSSPESSSDDNLQKQKQKLFGSFPGYGGLYGKLICRLDQLVLRLNQSS